MKLNHILSEMYLNLSISYQTGSVLPTIYLFIVSEILTAIDMA